MKRRGSPCPQCGKAVDAAAENPYRPFCSERCKLADLGQWFAGRYSIPAEDDAEAPPADTSTEPRTRQ